MSDAFLQVVKQTTRTQEAQMSSKKFFVEIVLVLWLVSVGLAVAADNHAVVNRSAATPETDVRPVYLAPAAQDAFVWSAAPKTNFGQNYYLRAGLSSSGDGFRIYLFFDFNSNGIRHQGNLQVHDALLRLECIEFRGNPGPVYCSPVTEPWNELGVCWENQPGIDPQSAAVTQVQAIGPSYWNVTGMVRDWFQGRKSNYGLCIHTDEMFWQDMSFLSRENRSPAEVPTLTVAFGPDIRVPQRSSAQLQNTGLTCIFNDPNPFREITWVNYSLGRESDISLAVFSADGRSVRNLESGPRQAGDYRVAWDGRDDIGRKTSRGIYYARLSTWDQVHEHKLVKTK
jgi:hypothetical protein